MSLFFIEGRQLLWHINMCTAKPQSSASFQPRPALFVWPHQNSWMQQQRWCCENRQSGFLCPRKSQTLHEYYVGFVMVLYMAYRLYDKLCRYWDSAAHLSLNADNFHQSSAPDRLWWQVCGSGSPGRWYWVPHNADVDDWGFAVCKG